MVGSMMASPRGLFGLFEQLRREFDDGFLPGSIRSMAGGNLPAVNLSRTPETLEVRAFAPGLDPAKTEVTLENGLLRIVGERAASLPAPRDGLTVYLDERGGGRFTRVISLPDDVDASKVSARYRDGVLQVSLGRREPARPQRIAVQ